MKKTIFVLTILVIICSCKKERQEVYSSSLIGEWIWVNTCGGFSGLCETPETTNSTNKLVYTADSMSYAYQNDSLISSNRFHTITQIPIAGDTVKLIQIDNWKVIYSINQNTLYLRPDGADFESMYKRIK